MVQNLSVIGLGKLGAPMLAVFAQKGFNAIGMDLNPAFVDAINEGRAPVPEPGLQEMITANRSRIRATTKMEEAVLDSDITFIIVPTPSGEGGFFRNDYVISAVKEIGAALRKKEGYHVVVITSTVMPGSTGGVIRQALEEASGRTVGDNLGLCYNPEFIALGTVVRDMLFPDMILIGESDDKAGGVLETVYRQSTESNPEFQRMNWVNAEICKISVNTYVTTKISYANMIADLCDHLEGADADVVTSALGADSRIGKKYIRGAIAYGGPCFPRDNKAFAALGRSLGANTDLAVATDVINSHQSVRLSRAVAKLNKPGAKVAILGLAYKPNTPVIEESQGLALAEQLLAAGFSVSLSDPEALESLSAASLPSGAAVEADPHAAIAKADIVIVMTAWDAYRQLSATEFAGKVVIDPWRLYAQGSLPAADKHVWLGWGSASAN